MSTSKVQEDHVPPSVPLEQDGLDIAFNQVRYRSVSSSRLSARLSQRSCVRDEAQTLDELLRKQRVIRYMEEERERAARTTILRDEHDEWIRFRAAERAERLQYLSEEQVQALLQREAEEQAWGGKKGLKALNEVHGEKGILRRRGSPQPCKSEPYTEAPITRHQTATQTSHARAPHSEAEKRALSTNMEDAGAASVELQHQEAQLIAECRLLKEQLSEACETASRAVRDREKAEKELARQIRTINESQFDTARSAKLQKQVEVLTKQLADLHGKLALTEADRRRLSILVEEGRDGIRLNQCVGEDVLRESKRESKELKRLQKEVGDSQVKLRALENDLAAREREIDQYRKKMSLAEKKSVQNGGYVSEISNQASEGERGMGKKAGEELKRVQNRLQKLQKELQLCKRERDSLQRELNSARENVAVAEKNVAREAADRKTIELLKRKVENLLHDHSRDASTIQCLKNELQSAQEELKYETTVRARFEELAAQAVDRNGSVPKEEVLSLKQQLEESKQELRRAHVEMEEANRKAQEEIQELKDWCTRLRERQDKQMRDMELALQDIPHDPQQHIRNNANVQVPDLRAKDTTNSRVGPKAVTSRLTLTRQQKHAAAGHATTLPEDTAASAETTESPYPITQERVRILTGVSVERVESEDPEPRGESTVPIQEQNKVIVRQLTALKLEERENKQHLCTKQVVQANVVQLEEPVPSPRPNIFHLEKMSQKTSDADGSNPDTANGAAPVAELKKMPSLRNEEVVEEDGDRLGMHAPVISYTQLSETDEAPRSIDMFSNARQISYASGSVHCKAKHRPKSDCNC